MATIVDFIPEINSKGDFNKVTDSDVVAINSAILNLFTLLEVERGTIPDMPFVGVANLLLKLFFSSSIDVAIEELSSACNAYVGYPVNITYTYQQSDIIDLYITISGLPARTRVTVANVNGRAKILKFGSIDQEG